MTILPVLAPVHPSPGSPWTWSLSASLCPIFSLCRPLRKEDSLYCYSSNFGTQHSCWPCLSPRCLEEAFLDCEQNAFHFKSVSFPIFTPPSFLIHTDDFPLNIPAQASLFLECTAHAPSKPLCWSVPLCLEQSHSQPPLVITQISAGIMSSRGLPWWPSCIVQQQCFPVSGTWRAFDESLVAALLQWHSSVKSTGLHHPCHFVSGRRGA
jgi:hypothetical protein